MRDYFFVANGYEKDMDFYAARRGYGGTAAVPGDGDVSVSGEAIPVGC